LKFKYATSRHDAATWCGVVVKHRDSGAKGPGFTSQLGTGSLVGLVVTVRGSDAKFLLKF